VKPKLEAKPEGSVKPVKLEGSAKSRPVRPESKQAKKQGSESKKSSGEN
jgi:hypothetical protein